MSQIVRMRERHSHPETDISKVVEVEEIAVRYQALRREIVQHYWAAEHLATVIHNPKSVITLRRHNDDAKSYPLGSHLQALAVSNGLDIIRGSWNQTFEKTRVAAIKRYPDIIQEIKEADGQIRLESIQNPARHEINWLLRWPLHLVTIYAGGIVIPTDENGPITKFKDNDHAKICHWLSLALRRYRSGQPSLKHKTTFEIDDYKCLIISDSKFSVWLSMSGLTKGKPLRIPMSGDDLEFLDSTANLRISVEVDIHGVKRIVFRRALKIEVEDRIGHDVVGLDKGANIATVATDSDPEHALFFGREAGDVLGRRSEKSYRRQRSRLASYADNLAGRHTPSGHFHGNPNPTRSEKCKAKHIRRNNLGSSRRDAEQRRCEAELRNIYGRVARELTEAYPNAIEFDEEKLDFKGSDQKRSRKTNRKIGRWAKKELSKAINSHVSASGACRKFVNAAYTSQACPRCSWPNRSNRKDQAFRCTHCGYRGHADAVASSNVLKRGSDRTITLFTSYKTVKNILLERHTEWRESVGADARCASRGCGSDLPVVSPIGSGDNLTV